MSGVSLPVQRPVGRSMVIGSVACRALPVEVLLHLGYQCGESDDPYSAMGELCRRPLAFRSVVLCLNSIYREELHVVGAIKRRFPHVEVWLAQTDGRPAALAEASRLGADGLLSEEGLHRFAVPEDIDPTRGMNPTPPPPLRTMQAAAPEANVSTSDEGAPQFDAPAGDPVLTADELRALLQEPLRPHRGEGR